MDDYLSPPRRDQVLVSRFDVEQRPPPWRDHYSAYREKFVKYKLTLAWPDEPFGLVCKCFDVRGATIIDVDKGSPAERAGIRQGLKVVSIHGVEITNEEDLLHARHVASARGETNIFVTTVSDSELHLAERPRAIPSNPNVSFKISDAVAIRAYNPAASSPRYCVYFLFCLFFFHFEYPVVS